MISYISLLRGINVNGQRLIKMDALKKMYEKLKFENIQTYIQSGNVIFSAKEKDPKKLEKHISGKIKKEFGFEVPVIVLTVKTLQSILHHLPYSNDKTKDTAFMHITFLSNTPAAFDEEKILGKKMPEEEISFAPYAVYLYCPGGYGKTKLMYMPVPETGKRRTSCLI